ncbi:ATP-binding cassette domain-containing protein [Microterricola viridarii]|uniref:ATP-binding cassette domain-containing protein n=1 Tax=Microterricola viridarii TaxID=412690 RepID=UPI0009EC9E1A|nr:ATP-binding cassette domain-containing protein [Microterricola viridarii]
MAQPLLELREITKAFGSKVANDRISLEVQPGRIHALVGENGAGKTTLMTMIAGTAQPDSGTIIIDGAPVAITNPTKASALGIGMVHQHFKLVPNLTVAANVFLGRELRTPLMALDTKKMEREVAALSEQFGLAIDPSAKVASLSVGVRQRVELLKALSHDTRLLILDEPTAVLTPGEIDELFVVVRGLAAKGCAVLFISHKLGEVLDIADELTVIRDGKSIATMPTDGLSQADIAQMMVGREVLLRIVHTEAAPTHEVLNVDALTVVDERGVQVVDSLSLTVRAGEIVGIAGVEGNGQTELAAAIAGMASSASGRIVLSGHDITTASVAERRRDGLAYIAEDRHEQGAGPSLSVAENIIPTHLEPPIARFGWINSTAANAFARRLIEKFDVRGAVSSTPIGTLSGGNMQKVIIAREFASEPELLMVAQPTRGVDVGAMEFVHNAIVAQRDKGAAVLLFSADLNEVMSLSDRLLVMFRGTIIAEFTQANMSEAAVGLAMGGVAPTADAVAAAEAEHALVRAELTGTPVAAASAAPLGATSAVDDASTHEAVAVIDRAAAAPAAAAAAAAPAAAATAAPAPRRERAAEKPAAPRRRVPDRSGDGRAPSVDIRTRLSSAAGKLGKGAIQPLVAVVLSLVVGSVFILAIGQDPLRAYSELFFSSLRTPYGISGLIAQLVPLLVLSAGVIISFRAGFFNIGGEGQLFIGAFAAAWAGFTFTDLPGPVLTVVVIAFGALGGMIWGMIPGALLAFWRTDIIVTTLMMSSIATLLTAYLVTGPFRDPTAGLVASEKIAPGAALPMFDVKYGIGMDLVLAIVIAIILALILTRTVWGLKVRQLGEMNRFAEYTGVNTRAMSIQVMALSGAVAGLAGAIFVLGPNGGRFLQDFSPGYGFLGITVALLARLNPWASFLAAAFYANMMSGSNGMQINTEVPFPIVTVLQGLIILMITAVIVIDRRTREKIVRLFAGRHGAPKAPRGTQSSAASLSAPAPVDPFETPAPIHSESKVTQP